MRVDLQKACRIALEECLGTREGEEVLVVTDTPMESIGRAFFEAAGSLGAEPLLLLMHPREVSGQEPPAGVGAALSRVQVGVLATSKSLSHTRARREATAVGVRIASLPGATEDMLIRALPVDYRILEEECLRFAQLLTQGREVFLTSPGGTRLHLGIEGRRGFIDAGNLKKPGSFGNLPAGEACIAPVEGTAQGVLVVDGSMAGIGLLQEPIKMRVEKGMVVEIMGGEEARSLERLLAPYGPEARNIAELGIGLNPAARITGRVLEDEKVKGTVHVAIGDNRSFGGQVEAPVHLDGVILRPKLYLDGQLILG